ncbi:MAG: PepSY domain-containing protein, partial [Bacteroidales bacterium]|nr:PepSY domain-containing protein [Bacteroidales bacterium]
KYEYTIDAKNGKVLEVEKETVKTRKAKTAKKQEVKKDNASGLITLKEAKAAALKKAGLKSQNVQFTKAKKEREDGRWVYDLEFCVKGKREYEVEIDARTGRVLEYDSEPWEDDD